ncbi:hypothetical protein OOG41_28120 [Bacillus sp. AS_5]|uniref:hypothetical protein n=1 Tax=unclassified Bacillus (in: firmicutes) TaxID=185979 RepID=UPI00224B3911|nr:hypothetical protein [Bacillus sp. AS_3]MCW4657491.1 hypothetical protein [Bacillus sp. AS_3]MCX2704949.1 hypothetical protein [Bacillus sp. AS_5]
MDNDTKSRNIIRPLLVSNCHELYGKIFFVTVLYVNGQRVNEYLQAEEDITNLNERYREYIKESGYECSNTIDIITSTEYIYVSTLGDSGLIGHVVPVEKTCETRKIFENEIVRDTLINLYTLEDPAILTKGLIKEPNRLKKMLIAALLKIAGVLNSLSTKLQTKRTKA